MRKLELKHLAGYLPYGLKVMHVSWKESLLMDCCGDNSESLSILDVEEYGKPILRPLSDLIKEIEVNREKFVPIVELSGYKDLKGEISFGYSHKKYYVKIRIQSTNEWACHTTPSDLYSMDYFTVQKLLEWHFDIYGLIEANLAIDINTL